MLFVTRERESLQWVATAWSTAVTVPDETRDFPYWRHCIPTNSKVHTFSCTENTAVGTFDSKVAGIQRLPPKTDTGDTKRTGTYEKPNKNWRNAKQNFIDKNWTITICLLRDSNPNYRYLKITSCRWRPPVRMHSFNLPLRFPIACCNISAGIPRISSWILCFNLSSVLGRVV